MIKVGIIGGSGLEKNSMLGDASSDPVITAYGSCSSPLTPGNIGGVDVLFLARHGENHEFSPTEVNYRANLSALKEAGVTHVLATTACGSLKEEIQRGDFVILDQFIDFTKNRKNTFFESFENGSTHPPMSDPFDEPLRGLLVECADSLGLRFHESGTVVTIEGPRFSSRAESRMFQHWGADVINMSVATEVILANELEIPYAAIAMSTDYDCWKIDEDPVSWEEIIKVLEKNSAKVEELLSAVIPKIR